MTLVLPILLLLSAPAAPPYTANDPKAVAALKAKASDLVVAPEFLSWDLSFRRCLFTADLKQAECAYQAWWGPVVTLWVRDTKWTRTDKLYTGTTSIKVGGLDRECLVLRQGGEAICGIQEWWGDVLVRVMYQAPDAATNQEGGYNYGEYFVRPQ